MNNRNQLAPRLKAAFWAALLILALPALAHAQGTPVYQSGLLSKPGNLPKMTRNGQYMDAGGVLGDTNGLGVNPFAITDVGGAGVCSNTVATGNSYNSICIGHDASGNALITVDSIGGPPAACSFSINNVLYSCATAGSGNVFGPPTTAVGNVVLWNALTGGLLADAGAPGTLTVPTNAALKALPAISTAGMVKREGFTASGDGGSANYDFSSSPCSLNAGAGDDGSQVKPNSVTGCWLANFPADGPSVAAWGAKADNATDAAVPLAKACLWAAANSKSLVLPSGTIYSSGTCTLAITATNASVTIRGNGSEVSAIRTLSGVTGITLTENSNTQSFHFRDFACLAGATNSGTCINVSQSLAFADPADTAISDITGVVCRGSGGILSANYWTKCVNLFGVSNVNFGAGTAVFGPTTAAGIGINISGTASIIPVVFNFGAVTINHMNYGIVYGNYVQGVSVGPGANFVGNNVAIEVPAGQSGNVQLAVTGSQFGYDVQADIDENTFVADTLLSNNLILDIDGAIGLKTTQTQRVNITGNSFVSLAGSCPGTTNEGIELGAVTNMGGTISGNSFWCYANGIKLLAGVDLLKINSNIFEHNTTAVANNAANTGVDIVGSYPVAGASISAAITDPLGSAVPYITVSPNTALFQTAAWVAYSGLVGTTFPTGISKVKVVDATHMLLININWGGTYTGGGTGTNIQTLP